MAPGAALVALAVHARPIPANSPFAHCCVPEGLVKLGPKRATRLQEPVVGRPARLELQRAQRVRDVFQRVHLHERLAEEHSQDKV